VLVNYEVDNVLKIISIMIVSMTDSYKSRIPFEHRRKEAEKIREQYNDRLPVIVEKSPLGGKSLPDIDKKKYLVPEDLTVAQFLYVIRKRLKIESNQAIFLFCNNNTLPVTSKSMQSRYDEQKDEDGFLYMYYCAESTFGSDM